MMMIMMLKTIKVMMLLGVMVTEATHSEIDNHNVDEHDKLCAFLQAAVAKYNEVKHSGSPLARGLRKAIFGVSDSNGKTPSDLRMPEDYNKPEDQDTENTRKNWCGLCENNGQKHYPGESAPHDLVCLCTTGQNGHPISGRGKKKLCGKTGDELGSAGKQGWYTELFKDVDKGNNQIKSTWNTIVTACLQDGNGKNFETALKTFTQKLERVENQSQLLLGNKKDGKVCSGVPSEGVCVLYHLQCARKPWWKELEEAIPEHEKWELEKLAEEKEQKLKDSKGPQTATEKLDQTLQPTLRVYNTPQNDETHDHLKAEKLIANITSTQKEDGSQIIRSQWLFLYDLLI
ncbi:Variant surface glycoprotein [Trypanosoma congolense IL3000]|uniref:Variant surface glycoprotein n=1 Tax=Trypanosoma congolense (strain IL3000) TaxID=1068625 RepID=F9W683_TRYCI|nr:Variant surface glycoprotein [Trypanosoma congolense IL3000]